MTLHVYVDTSDESWIAYVHPDDECSFSHLLTDITSRGVLTKLFNEDDFVDLVNTYGIKKIVILGNLGWDSTLSMCKKIKNRIKDCEIVR